MMENFFNLSIGMYEIKKAKKYPISPVKRWLKKSESKKSRCMLFIKKLEIITKLNGIKRSGENKNFHSNLFLYLKNPLFLIWDITLNMYRYLSN